MTKKSLNSCETRESVTSAAQRDDFNSVAQQLLSGADPNERDSDGWSALHFACCHANRDAVQWLIKAMADVDLMARDGLTPLHRVAMKLDDNRGLSIVSMLIEAGADVNASMGIDQLSPLHLALQQRRVRMASALIKAGANLESSGHGTYSPFYLAIEFGFADIAAEMIAAGASIDQMDVSDFSLLHFTIEHGRTDIAKMLVAAGADVEIHSEIGFTPLHLAVFYGREAVVDLLIEAQADVNCMCTSDLLFMTPLSISAATKRSNLMKLLIDAGATVNIAMTNSFSALYLAVLTGDRVSCRILLEAGATAGQKDTILQLCLALAKKRGFTDVVDLFGEKRNSTTVGQRPVATSTAVPNGSLARSRQPMPGISEAQESDLSESLSASMHRAGFNSVNAIIQSGAVALLEAFSRKVQKYEGMFLFGSFSDGWGSCLTAINGRVDDDSDIDITYLSSTVDFCMQEFCRNPECNSNKFKYFDGHVQVSRRIDATGPNAAVLSVLSNTAVDFIRAHRCCCYPTIELLKPGYQTNISPHILEALKREVHSPESLCHVVSAGSPRLPKGQSMRVSTTLLERILMHNLTTIQGQLFILLKYLIKKVMKYRVQGLKTYIAKNLLFHMLDRTPAADWQPKNLIGLMRRALRMLVEMMSESESDDACMVHFFLRDAAVYLKRDQSPKTPKMEILECLKDVIDELPELLTAFEQKLEINDPGVIYR